MKTRSVLIIFIVSVLGLGCNKDKSEIDSPDNKMDKKWNLIWSDEFDVPEINATNWVHEIGDGTLYGDNPGWGNNQKQLYTDDPTNSYISTDDQGNSVLVIEAIKNGTDPDYPYTSARMTTEGLQSFRYGKIEARIKLPYGQGIWPAFWTMGINKPECGWPGCGEIDIMEMLGNQEEHISGNVHYINADGQHDEDLSSSMITSGKYSDDYHVYSVTWTPDSIQWLVDDKMYYEKPITADMMEFKRSQYIILNVAVGGYWPGYPDETSVFPQKMLVDYVRVYEDTTLTTEPEIFGAPCEEMSGGVNDSTIAKEAISSTFNEFQNIKIVAYGPGTMPQVTASQIAIDGNFSVLASFPGEDWGGLWFELSPALDMSAFSDGHLIVSLIIPSEITDFEVKLESIGGVGSVNLLDYPPVALAKGFFQYTIPLADFTALGLNLDQLTVPFSLWNPKDENGNYVKGDALIDNLYFE